MLTEEQKEIKHLHSLVETLENTKVELEKDCEELLSEVQRLLQENRKFEWELDGARFRWDGKNIQSQTCHEREWRPCIDGILAAFEAGRCYQRERGDE